MLFILEIPPEIMDTFVIHKAHRAGHEINKFFRMSF